MRAHDGIGTALLALGRAHRTRLAALLAPHGLHPGQDLLLMVLWESPGLSQSSLATRLGVEAPTVTRMLQRLERGGLIERRRAPHDGRVVVVHPTPRSRLLESTVRRAWHDIDERLIGALGEVDAAKLQRLARASTRALESDAGSD